MSLHDTDFVAWTQQQAARLRSMPRTDDLDIDHLTDEIEGLGRTSVADLSTAIRQLLTGLISRSIDPASIRVEDILAAQSEAIIRADAGVWRHVDDNKVWRLAKRSVEARVPERCPIRVEQLISEEFDVAKALASLRL